MLSWLPENVSTYGKEIDALIALIYYITLAWFVLTAGALLLFLFRFRHREGRRPAYLTGERFREVAWLLGLGVVVLGARSLDRLSRRRGLGQDQGAGASHRPRGP
ncbi:MAG: hypothetical protein HYV61_04850, partial [Candidatus Rokubacteria bacterium]|nr:hypothetical protein [Candidatus Rokubacteria bacterium]